MPITANPSRSVACADNDHAPLRTRAAMSARARPTSSSVSIPSRSRAATRQKLEAFRPGQGDGVGGVDGHGAVQCVEDVEGAGVGRA